MGGCRGRAGVRRVRRRLAAGRRWALEGLPRRRWGDRLLLPIVLRPSSAR